MEESKTTNVLLDNELQINRTIGKILYAGCLVGPVLFLFTRLGVFEIDKPFCFIFTIYSVVVGAIQTLLIKNNKYHKIARYFGIFALEIMIGFSATKVNIGIYISLCFAAFLSALYVNLAYTRFVTVISYLVMVIAQYFRAFDAEKYGYLTDTKAEYFQGYVVGFTIEFIFVYLICQAIVKYEKSLLESKEREVSERLEAQEENKAKSDFLAQMSHEIRTPINAVLGMNEIILRETNQPEIEGYAITIKNAGKSLLNIVNEILDFSKIQSGKMEIVPVDYDSAAMIKDLIELYSVAAVSKGLDFEYNVCEELPKTLFGDEYRIKQAAGNLISNAIKYTEKGFINLQVDYQKEDSKVIISVVDSGIGIKTEDIPKLFQNFGRLDLKKNRSIQGTGLGLMISKQLVEMMGGTLCVQSVYGEGSIFTITVPQECKSTDCVGQFKEEMKRQEEESYAASKGERQLIAENARILIVDDNDMNLQVAASLLKRTKAHVDCVTSGQECLLAVEAEFYDLILLDHMMPEMDGIEVLKRLRGEKPYIDDRTKVVVLTANAIAGAKENYLKEGFDDYISKPIAIEELERVLMEHLPADKVNMEESVEEDAEVMEYPDLSSYGINTEQGVTLMDGDFDVYIDMVKVFHADYPVKHEKMKKALEQSDMEAYAIMVHGLKSNARTLGAAELGEIAYDEELKSKAGDAAYIQKHMPILEAEWAKVISGFDELFKLTGNEDDADGTAELQVEVTEGPLSEDEIFDRMLIVLACLEGFQEEEAVEAMKEFLSHPLEEKMREDLNNALSMVSQFDYDGAIQALGDYLPAK
ncbi:MAG: response regulator [Lachnospiraceae bacterium]|nr:response regulator [Lachnospiraceae bacterium]